MEVDGQRPRPDQTEAHEVLRRTPPVKLHVLYAGIRVINNVFFKFNRRLLSCSQDPPLEHNGEFRMESVSQLNII